MKGINQQKSQQLSANFIGVLKDKDNMVLKVQMADINRDDQVVMNRSRFASDEIS